MGVHRNLVKQGDYDSSRPEIPTAGHASLLQRVSHTNKTGFQLFVDSTLVRVYILLSIKAVRSGLGLD